MQDLHKTLKNLYPGGPNVSIEAVSLQADQPDAASCTDST